MDRKDVLKFFEKNEEFFESTVNENIEKYRKGDSCITVVDNNGHSVENARISINQISHEFKFGANIFLLEELETQEKNRLYKEYLGVDVPCDAKGVLQDSHWAGGAIGYFPSYARGSAYGAHLYKKMKETVNVEECLSKGDFAPINEWNKEHIWKFGSLKKSSEILRDALGEEFDPLYYTAYLEEKFKELYKI